MTVNLDKTQSELAQCLRDVETTQQRFKNIIEKNADGILIVDQEGYVQFANPAAEALFGRLVEELTGKVFGFPLIAGETAELDILRPNKTQAVVKMRVVATEWEHQPAYLVSLRATLAHGTSSRPARCFRTPSRRNSARFPGNAKPLAALNAPPRAAATCTSTQP